MADTTTQTRATDPVCGMTVDVASAKSARLSAEHNGVTYYFCGRGCMLDFKEDPDKYLDPGYRPSM
jgi:YHS domain-containing protein